MKQPRQLTPDTFENLAFKTGALIELDATTAHMTIGGQEYVTAVSAR